MNLFVPRLALGVSLLVGACTPALVHTESPAQSMQLSQNSPEAMNPETFLDWGRQRTQIGDWQGAIANFQAAADGFAGQGDETRQAMAEAIVRYLDWWLGWSDRQRESAEVEMMPDWLSFGRCVEDQTGHVCGYSLQFVQSDKDEIEGVLLLQNHIYDVPMATGGSYGVFGILAAEAVSPPLQGGESWIPFCERLDGEDSAMMAIVQTHGYEDADEYPEIREVWWVNLEEESLEFQKSPSHIRCWNPCPGGC
ncbi:hypothetical protein NEA10_07580 [Phormidium yuhuli AB48]|uniref:Uncharacterized protein n=1 Tax=Phormidium yuhuli AB48 TaxID=2940671 RepID=A0ABY5AWW3_9CYAN|nr:hypothetical protein [Phormidium yuhuli]USR92568.1 hypothetical protein NEA10_07580 [Phormidium yuhuli AB48]